VKPAGSVGMAPFVFKRADFQFRTDRNKWSFWFPSALLKRNHDCDPDARVIPVIHVIPAIDVININVVGFVPRRRPILRPWIHERDPVAVVLETRIPAHEKHRKGAHAEEVLSPEVEPEAVIGNSVAVIAAALLPGAVLRIP